MIDKILEFSVRQRVLVLMGALALLLGGLWSATKLPMDAIPDITGVQVQVNTTVPALAPDEVEKLVTVPLEMALGGVAGVTEMRSLSRFGLSQITLQFTDKSDIYRARQLVTERLQSAADSLPPGLTPKLIPITTGLGEVFYYTIDYAPNAPNAPPTREAQLMALWEMQEYIIKPQLRAVPGVAEVNAYGGYVKQIVVQPNIAKLRDAGLTVNDLAKVVGENVENAGGGIVNAGSEQLVIRGVGRVSSLQEIAELPVKFAAGVMPLRVKDFAEVQIGHAFRTGAATHSGQEAVLGVAMMLMGENSNAVAGRVAEKIGEIQKRLPSGVIISPEYNRKNLVHRTIRTVTTNLFEGALLVIAVLLFLLGNWRAALIVAAAIPTGPPFRDYRHDAVRNFGEPDESWGYRFWAHHRRRCRHRRKRCSTAWRKTAPTRATPDNRRAAACSYRRQQTSRHADVLWCADHCCCLSADSRAVGHRRKNVSPDGADSNARPGRIIGAGAYFNACAVLISTRRTNRRTRQFDRPPHQEGLFPHPSLGVATTLVGCARCDGAIRAGDIHLPASRGRFHSEAR